MEESSPKNGSEWGWLCSGRWGGEASGSWPWGFWAGGTRVMPGTAQGTGTGFSVPVSLASPAHPSQRGLGQQDAVPCHAGTALQGAPWPWHKLGFFSPVLHPLLEELPNPLAGSICSVPIGAVGSPSSGTRDRASPPWRGALAMLWGLQGVLCLLVPSSTARGEKMMPFGEAHRRRCQGISDACMARMS